MKKQFSRKYPSYNRPLCFNVNQCENPQCTYRHYKIPQDKPSYYKQKRQKEQKFLKKVKDTAKLHQQIKQLRQKFPNFDKKIEQGSKLYLQQLRLKNILHLLKTHLDKDGHIDYYIKGTYCNQNCENYFENYLSQKLLFGKYKEKTWEQVEKEDPQYIDWICKKFDKDNIKRKISDHIVKGRKSKKNEHFQVCKALSEISPPNKHIGKTWEQIEKEDPKYINWIYSCYGKECFEYKIAQQIIKRRRAQQRQNNQLKKDERQNSRSRSRQKYQEQRRAQINEIQCQDVIKSKKIIINGPAKQAHD